MFLNSFKQKLDKGHGNSFFSFIKSTFFEIERGLLLSRYIAQFIERVSPKTQGKLETDVW